VERHFAGDAWVASVAYEASARTLTVALEYGAADGASTACLAEAKRCHVFFPADPWRQNVLVFSDDAALAGLIDGVALGASLAETSLLALLQRLVAEAVSQRRDVWRLDLAPGNERVRAAAALEVRAALNRDAAACDMTLALLSAAASSRRRATALVPIPLEYRANGDGGDARYDALAHDLATLGDVCALDGALERHPALALLHEVLVRPRYHLRSCPDAAAAAEAAPAASPATNPVARFRVERRSSEPLRWRRLCVDVGVTSAFHGSPAENWFGILTTGLESRSGTKLERNGAMLGNGVYLAADARVSDMYCSGSACIAPRRACVLGDGSTLDGRHHIVARCDVVARPGYRKALHDEPARRCDDGAPRQLPSDFVVVHDTADIRICELLVFGQSNRPRPSDDGPARLVPALVVACAALVVYFIRSG